jgi:hypothetical protein
MSNIFPVLLQLSLGFLGQSGAMESVCWVARVIASIILIAWQNFDVVQAFFGCMEPVTSSATAIFSTAHTMWLREVEDMVQIRSTPKPFATVYITAVTVTVRRTSLRLSLESTQQPVDVVKHGPQVRFHPTSQNLWLNEWYQLTKHGEMWLAGEVSSHPTLTHLWLNRQHWRFPLIQHIQCLSTEFSHQYNITVKSTKCLQFRHISRDYANLRCLTTRILMRRISTSAQNLYDIKNKHRSIRAGSSQFLIFPIISS